MATYPTTTLTRNLLVADDLQSSSGTTKTQINLTNSSCALEMQSTTGGFVLPRMTTTQRNALTGTSGMMVYNTTSGSFDTYGSTAWNSGVSYVTATLTQANLTSMSTTPILVLGAPSAGANYMYVVQYFVIKALYNNAVYDNGGAIYLQYGSAAAGPAATSTISETLLTTNSNQAAVAVGTAGPGALAIMTGTTNLAGSLYITNETADFGGGDIASTATYYLYYSTVSVA